MPEASALPPGCGHKNVIRVRPPTGNGGVGRRESALRPHSARTWTPDRPPRQRGRHLDLRRARHPRPRRGPQRHRSGAAAGHAGARAGAGRRRLRIEGRWSQLVVARLGRQRRGRTRRRVLQASMRTSTASQSPRVHPSPQAICSGGPAVAGAAPDRTCTGVTPRLATRGFRRAQGLLDPLASIVVGVEEPVTSLPIEAVETALGAIAEAVTVAVDEQIARLRAPG